MAMYKNVNKAERSKEGMIMRTRIFHLILLDYKSIVVTFISAPSSLRNSPRIIFIPVRGRGERIRLILY